MMDTLQFLKKYTPVDGIFIDDFFSLYDLESNQSSCVINLEVVAKWLESTKAGLTKTLKESYVNGVDYTITKTIQQPNNGRTLNAKKTVLISPDCLKRICMLSRSKNAEKLRTYFLITEKSLFNYKNEIMEGMNSRIGILENNQKSKKNLPVGGVIYIIAASDSMNSRFKLQRALRYKIGKTKDARTRLRSHSSASADNVKVVYMYKTNCMDAVETCAKAMLKKYQYRSHKEIYEADESMIRDVINGCGKVCMTVDRTSLEKVEKVEKLIHGGGKKGTTGMYMVFEKNKVI